VYLRSVRAREPARSCRLDPIPIHAVPDPGPGPPGVSSSTVAAGEVRAVVDVKKQGTAPGDCPNWHGDDALDAELKKTGRVRLYGINFDSDSDVLRPESKGTLDQIVATLKKDTALKLTIEGHTDSTSTPQHNQELSEKRAAAVKAYLVTGGIEAGRLATAGFGASRPVATNESAIGRAENRRVELARQ